MEIGLGRQRARFQIGFNLIYLLGINLTLVVMMMVIMIMMVIQQLTLLWDQAFYKQ